MNVKVFNIGNKKIKQKQSERLEKRYKEVAVELEEQGRNIVTDKKKKYWYHFLI